MVNSISILNQSFPELAASAGAILANCTIYPWMVSVRYAEPGGRVQVARHVIEGLLHSPPDGVPLTPDGCECLSVVTFPATHFDDMPLEMRQRFRAEYKTYLMWRKAKAFSKPVAELVPWKDYDPVHIDESVERWVKPFGRYAGD